jgi:hypothetical protein
MIATNHAASIVSVARNEGERARATPRRAGWIRGRPRTTPIGAHPAGAGKASGSQRRGRCDMGTKGSSASRALGGGRGRSPQQTWGGWAGIKKGSGGSLRDCHPIPGSGGRAVRGAGLGAICGRRTSRPRSASRRSGSGRTRAHYPRSRRVRGSALQRIRGYHRASP